MLPVCGRCGARIPDDFVLPLKLRNRIDLRRALCIHCVGSHPVVRASGGTVTVVVASQRYYSVGAWFVGGPPRRDANCERCGARESKRGHRCRVPELDQRERRRLFREAKAKIEAPMKREMGRAEEERAARVRAGELAIGTIRRYACDCGDEVELDLRFERPQLARQVRSDASVLCDRCVERGHGDLGVRAFAELARAGRASCALEHAGRTYHYVGRAFVAL